MGGQWYALKNSLGFRFDVHNVGNLTLPAAESPDLRSARPVGPEDLNTLTQGGSTS